MALESSWILSPEALLLSIVESFMQYKEIDKSETFCNYSESVQMNQVSSNELHSSSSGYVFSGAEPVVQFW